jgi:SWI/SNF-related matrix-associated actin-dependent regulator of chromatin subfamily A-like protein 1
MKNMIPKFKSVKKEARIHEAKGVQSIHLDFPYSANNVSEARGLQGASWNVKAKYWRAALTLENLLLLKSYNYYLCDELKRWGNQRHKAINVVKPVTEIPNLPKGLKLYPYQSEGVSFAEYMDGRALIADEMGLGKTVQALSWLVLRQDIKRVVIVTTATMKGVWEGECAKWVAGRSVQVIQGTAVDTLLTADILIINYDVLAYWVKRLQEEGIQAAILDECHKISNPTTIRTKQTVKLCSSIPYIIGLTGTPMNKPRHLYSIINIIKPGLFPSRFHFMRRYCGAKHNGFGWDFNGSSNEKELHELLTKNVMIRRLKKDVLKDLPEKTYTFVPLDLCNRGEYRLAERDFETYIRDKLDAEVRGEFAKITKDLKGLVSIDEQELEFLKQEKTETLTVLAQIEELKQLAVKGKMPSILQWVDDFLETGEKLVLFCEHTAIVDRLMTHYEKIAVKIDGRVPPAARREVANQFQTNDKIRLFVGNSAAQEGLTLTKSSNVAIIELPWTWDALAQRVDRVHRITQKRGVMVWYLLASQTIEEKIAKILDSTRVMAEQILDGKAPEQKDLLTELFKQYGHY